MRLGDGRLWTCSQRSRSRESTGSGVGPQSTLEGRLRLEKGHRGRVNVCRGGVPRETGTRGRGLVGSGGSDVVAPGHPRSPRVWVAPDRLRPPRVWVAPGRPRITKNMGSTKSSPITKSVGSTRPTPITKSTGGARKDEEVHRLL